MMVDKKKLVRKKIPSEYDLKGKIIEFRKGDHSPEDLFCLCEGGFGAVHYTMGRMICGKFYPTLEDTQNDTNGTNGNTKAFPIAWWVEEQDNHSVTGKTTTKEAKELLFACSQSSPKAKRQAKKFVNYLKEKSTIEYEVD